MKDYCDLHTHSSFSDGTCAPAELIRLAEEVGLGAVALCDHNTVAGLPEFLKAAEGSSVEAVPGIEFSTDYEGKELHILALFVKSEHYGRINDLLDDVKKKGDYVREAMTGAKGVKSVSGLGLMIGIETEKDASEILAKCRENGVLVIKAKHKVRLLPALNIPMEQLKKAVEILLSIMAE